MLHPPPLLFQTLGSQWRQEGFVQAPEQRRPEKAGVPCQLLCFTPKECRGGEGNAIPPPFPCSNNGHPARLQGAEAGRKRREGRREEGWGRRDAGVAWVLWYHHVWLGDGSGWAGGGGGDNTR